MAKSKSVSSAEAKNHVTTIAGPQAEALLHLIRGDKLWHIEDKSVPGLAVVEVWTDG